MPHFAAQVLIVAKTILDLGCGGGRTLDWFGVTSHDKVIGLDVDLNASKPPVFLSLNENILSVAPKP